MLRVTWEWLGQDRAIDLANTVAVVDGHESDLVPTVAEYERWATAEVAAHGLDRHELAALVAARARLLALRPPVRAVLAAAATRDKPPPAAVDTLNHSSRTAPEWLELDPETMQLRHGNRGHDTDRVTATYARSAMTLVAADAPVEIRACPAPSCGMFYRPGRSDQHWCSPQCGSRARVARHYRAHNSKRRAQRRKG